MVDGVKPQPQSKKWKLYPIVGLSLLVGLLYFAYWYYLEGGIEEIEYGLRYNPDETIGRVWGRILAAPIISTIVAVIHNVFVK